jgi:hypothetical protein
VIPARLPNLDTLDIEALKALVIAQHSEFLQQHESSHQRIEHLKLVIEKYRRMIFGSKSEKLKGQLEQLEFQLEELKNWRRSRLQRKRHSPVLLELQASLDLVLRASLCRKIFRVKSSRIFPRRPAVRIVAVRCVSSAKMYPNNWNEFQLPTR